MSLFDLSGKPGVSARGQVVGCVSAWSVCVAVRGAWGRVQCCGAGLASGWRCRGRGLVARARVQERGVALLARAGRAWSVAARRTETDLPTSAPF